MDSLDFADLLNFDEYLKLFIGLLAIAQPFLHVPVFLNLVRERPVKEQRAIANITAATFAGILIVFAFFGDDLLDIFAISVPGFRVAGGILLLLTAISMMRGKQQAESISAGTSKGLAVGIVPLATPLLAGPGAISTVIVYSNIERSLGHELVLSLVIIAMSLVVGLTFNLAPAIRERLSDTMMQIITQVMGLLVAAIGVEFILDGVALHFPDIFKPVGH